MKKILLATALLAVSLSMTACTDAEMASFGALGEQANVTCWSGNQVIREYVSTGKVAQLDGDGISFKNAKTGKYVRSFADCIVEEM
jgi:hypothetical protein